ncbi:MAG: NAD(P)/FAD-dependent oxidoreductase [Nitrospirae bacterium]|nr:NAD(P)/FAD-dependent oxidoreductase [Nitrospirota bacterium]
MNAFDVAIIGGGAAGLMCGFTAGRRGRRVLVLERSNKVGKKILMSGGGRCNFTNLHIEPDRFLSANPHFCKSALSRYTQWDFIDLMKRHGIAFHEKAQGQLFYDESSKPILAMLLQECDRAGVRIETRCEVERIEADRGFRLATNQGTFQTDALVVASGGLSIPSLGGSGFGYEIARQFGLRVLPRWAGLVPFTFTDAFRELSSRLSGLSVPVRVTTGAQSFTDSILFTHRGLSGPAVLQLSSYWQPGESVEVDLLPDRDVLALLNTLKHTHPKTLLRTGLTQYLPKGLVTELEALWWPEWAEKSLAELPGRLMAELAGRFGRWVLRPAATEGYRTAEVTVGGVDTHDLSSKSMASHTHPGLYFIGEVVDVTGHLGGFNFQWAWSSGHAAGESV